MGKQRNWTRKWKTWVRPTRHPGIWEREKGGYLVRVRAIDPTCGRAREVRKVLHRATLAEAIAFFDEERERVRAGQVLVTRPQQRFADFAVSLLERKIDKGEIRSAASRNRWKHTLEHLIAGTHASDDMFVPGFGEFFVEQIRPLHVERWKEGMGRLIAAGHYAPTTANGWLSILRVVMKAARREFELPMAATEGVDDFDTSEWVTYPEEEPNSLAPDDVPRFLSVLREMFPQHYAMAHLGFATGLRPSSLRPLRRAGDTADVLWDQGRLLVRQSQTYGSEVLKTTKQKTRYAIDLPEDVVEVLRWHVQTQLVTPEQQESDLLFPSIVGGFRAPTVLNKPFAVVSEEIGLGYAFTQRGMRRTFNDLCRAARVEDIVTRSISGHLTERMQHHYSTVRGDEQRASIAKVIDLMTAREARALAENGTPTGTPAAPESSVVTQSNNAPPVPDGAPRGTPNGTPPKSSGTLPPAGRTQSVDETKQPRPAATPATFNKEVI